MNIMRLLSIKVITLMVVTMALAADDLKTGNLEFTKIMFQNLNENKRNENMIFSPINIQIMMALLTSAKYDYNYGAIQEIVKAMKLPSTKAKTEQEFKWLLEQLVTEEDDFKFFDASKIYFKYGYQVQDWYKRIARNSYHADTEIIDFSYSQAANNINNWVAGRTDNQINSFIGSGDLSNAQMILINALYLKGKWVTGFKDSDTTQENFYGPKGTKKVNMMRSKRTQYYYEDNVAQYLKMPLQRYEGDPEMVFVLPRKAQGLEELIKNNINSVFSPIDDTPLSVNVTLPKFTIANNLQLKPILTNLGIHTIFQFNAMPYDGFSLPWHPYSQVTDVFQKSLIEINESGVTAAAAGAVKSFVDGTPPQKEFRADHPFLFYIRVHGVIVFAGKVVDP